MKENVKKQLICSEMIGKTIQDMEFNHARKLKKEFHWKIISQGNATVFINKQWTYSWHLEKNRLVS